MGENISRFNCCDPHSLSEVHTFIVIGKNRFGNKIADQLNPAVFRLNRRNTSCNHKLPAFQLTAGLLDHIVVHWHLDPESLQFFKNAGRVNGFRRCFCHNFSFNSQLSGKTVILDGVNFSGLESNDQNYPSVRETSISKVLFAGIDGVTMF